MSSRFGLDYCPQCRRLKDAGTDCRYCSQDGRRPHGLSLSEMRADRRSDGFERSARGET